MSQGTQVFSRQQIASAGLPEYVREAEGLIERATQEKDRGTRTSLYEKALQIVQSGLGQNKRAVHDCILLAECCWELVKPQESIEYLKEAIQLAPKDGRPYALLGRYLLYKGLRDQALNFLDRAIQLDPDDHNTRKLRERAVLQKKKQYTVVVNAADIAALAPQKKESASNQHKAEATRLIEVGKINEATAELAKAEHGAKNELDRALNALLGGTVSSADVGILVPEAQSSTGGNIVRAVIAFVFIVGFGLVAGVLAQQVAPKGASSPSESITTLLLADRTSTLLDAATQADESPDGALGYAGALAHALLFVEHAGEASHREAAMSLLETLSADDKKRPETLLARALFEGLPRTDGASDESLDADIEAALAAGGPSRVFAVLAQAERATQSGDDERALAAWRDAAFDATPSNRALHRLARREAANGHPEAALALVERLWAREPFHGPSLATAVALAMQLDAAAGDSAGESAPDDAKDAAPDDGAGKGGEGETAAPAGRGKSILARVEKLVDDPELPAVDAASPAITLALVALARGDDGAKDRTLSIAIGSSSTGPVTQNPMLLEAVTMIRILEFDPKGALTLLDRNAGLVDSTVALQRNVTRATVLDGIGDQLRNIKLQSPKPSFDGAAFVLPAGRVLLDYARPLLPLTPEYDPRFFPETAIQIALELKGISPTVAKRKLATVADIKLAQIALARDDAGKAREYLKRARTAADSDPEYHLMSALVSTAEGDKAGARDAIEDALDLAPDEPRVLVAAARIQLAAGDTAAALRAVKKLQDEGYSSPAALALGARALAKRNDVEGARAAIAQALAITDDDVDVLAAEIDVEDTVGEPERAITTAQRAVALAPTRARALAQSDAVAAPYLLHALAGRKDGATAMDQLKDAVEKNAAKAAPAYALGLLLLGKKATKAEGVELLKRATTKKGQAAAAAQRKLDELDGKAPAAADDKDAKDPKGKGAKDGGKKDKKPKKGKKGR